MRSMAFVTYEEVGALTALPGDNRRLTLVCLGPVRLQVTDSQQTSMTVAHPGNLRCVDRERRLGEDGRGEPGNNQSGGKHADVEVGFRGECSSWKSELEAIEARSLCTPSSYSSYSTPAPRSLINVERCAITAHGLSRPLADSRHRSVTGSIGWKVNSPRSNVEGAWKDKTARSARVSDHITTSAAKSRIRSSCRSTPSGTFQCRQCRWGCLPLRQDPRPRRNWISGDAEFNLC